MHQRGKSRWALAGVAVDRPVDRLPCWQRAVGAPVDCSVDRFLQRKHSFLNAVDRAVDPNKPRVDLLTVGRPVGRPTDVHKRARPDTGAGRPGGQPVNLKQGNLADFWSWKFCEKIF